MVFCARCHCLRDGAKRNLLELCQGKGFLLCWEIGIVDVVLFAAGTDKRKFARMLKATNSFGSLNEETWLEIGWHCIVLFYRVLQPKINSAWSKSH